MILIFLILVQLLMNLPLREIAVKLLVMLGMLVLQEIIQLLSLSKQGRRRRSGRGRISYAQLGINQLGAVYEGLLSYTGFFAKETLYEVKKADDNSEDENRQAYFIPESEVEKYQLRHYRRFSFKPGITGLWQVSGRNEIKNFEDWVKLDLGDPFATQEYCVTGYPVLETLPYELSLGANLISYLGGNDDLIINALGQYNDNFNAIIGAASAAYNSTNSGWVGSLTNLKKGNGYWVIVNDNFIFHWADE